MQIIKKAKLIEESVGENEWMLCDEGKENIHLLNGTAAFLYRLCNDNSLDEIIDRYVDEFQKLDVPIEQLKKDALGLYKQLKEMGIVWEEDLNWVV